MSKTIFDLRQHSSVDLARLDMALDTGIVQCGDNANLRDLKESLLAYKLIVGQAHIVACGREADEMFRQELAKIISSN
jgi:hypothetical protein